MSHATPSTTPSLLLAALAALAAVALTPGCKKAEDAPPPAPAPGGEPAPAAKPEPPANPATLGLFDPPAPPSDNAFSPEKLALGRQLFYDKRLSSDGSMACEGCHHYEQGWTDGLQFSPKVGGAMNTRNTPTLYNMAYQSAWYWDGRSTTLEAQIFAAWKGQMGADPAAIAAKLAAIPGYAEAFTKVFGAPPSPDNIPQALATFIRSLVAGGSPWDRYEAGDKTAVSADVVAGKALFFGKAQCIFCHMPPLYSDGMFHNIGLEHGKATPDQGRGKVTQDPRDDRAFKTPSLRPSKRSAPYFHDGSAKTLEDAVRYMAAGGNAADPGRDPRLMKVELTDEEIKQIVAFLEALAPDQDTPAPPPTLP